MHVSDIPDVYRRLEKVAFGNFPPFGDKPGQISAVVAQQILDEIQDMPSADAVVHVYTRLLEICAQGQNGNGGGKVRAIGDGPLPFLIEKPGLGLAGTLSAAKKPRGGSKPLASRTPAPCFLGEPCWTVLPATAGPFDPEPAFKLNEGNVDLPSIGHIDDSFRRLVSFEIVGPTPETSFCHWRLNRNGVLQRVVDELGGEEKARSSLLHAYLFLKAQKRGETGPLHVDKKNWNNSFLVPSSDPQAYGKLVLASFRWDWERRNWVVYARRIILDRREYMAHEQVFFPGVNPQLQLT